MKRTSGRVHKFYYHRKHSSNPLPFRPESKGNTRWPKYKPTAISLPYQTCLLRYKSKLASCHALCHWSFEIMIKSSYESFWSQYYMFLGESFRAEFLGTLLSCQLRYKKKKKRRITITSHQKIIWSLCRYGQDWMGQMVRSLTCEGVLVTNITT